MSIPISSLTNSQNSQIAHQQQNPHLYKPTATATTATTATTAATTPAASAAATNTTTSTTTPIPAKPTTTTTTTNTTSTTNASLKPVTTSTVPATRPPATTTAAGRPGTTPTTTVRPATTGVPTNTTARPAVAGSTNVRPAGSSTAAVLKPLAGNSTQTHSQHHHYHAPKVEMSAAEYWLRKQQEEAAVSLNCSSCGGNFVQDHKSGDVICEDCGLVGEERMIEEESEIRVFNDDPESMSRIRTGPTTNINIDAMLGSGKQKNVREEKEFLHEGFKLINQILEAYFSGGAVHADLKFRAQELFQQAFYQQVDEKRNGRNSNGQKGNRQRFSKKKQLVYASIVLAFQKTKAAGTANTKEIYKLLSIDEPHQRIIKLALKEVKKLLAERQANSLRAKTLSNSIAGVQD